MDPSASIGDAFYFAVETFLTIGYGDITPASNTAKVFFILYTVLSLVVQLTVVTTFVSSTLSMTPEQDTGSTTAPSSVRPHNKLCTWRQCSHFSLIACLKGLLGMSRCVWVC